MSSPTQRSKAKLQREGYTVAITERWNSFTRTRQDLFGFIDLIALRGNETLAVQTTSGSNVSARIDKIKSLQSARVWLESNSRRIVVHGWRKVGARGKRKLWDCREEWILTETESRFRLLAQKEAVSTITEKESIELDMLTLKRREPTP